MATRDIAWLASTARARGIRTNPVAEPAVEALQILRSDAPVDIAIATSLLQNQKARRLAENAPSRGIKVIEKLSKINSLFAFEDYQGAIRDVFSRGDGAGVLYYLLREFWQDSVKSAKTKLSKRRDVVSNDDKHLLVESYLSTAINQNERRGDINWLDTICVLSGYARNECLNRHLNSLIQKDELVMVKIMLQRDADPGSCIEALENTIQRSNFDLIRLLLRARIKWSDDILFQSLLLSMPLPSTRIFQLLLAHGADMNRQDAFALQRALDMQRLDLLLMMLTARSIPTPTSLDQAVAYLFDSEKSLHASKRFEMLEPLLRAGAAGDNVSRALKTTVKEEDWLAADLLLKNGALSTYDDGEAFLHLVRNFNLHALRLFEKNLVGPSISSRAFSMVSTNEDLDPYARLELFQLLLQHGAQGSPVDDALITVVRNADIKATRLLLDHHASVNHCSAEALRLAITTEQHNLVDLLWKYNPSLESLQHLFPYVQNISRSKRQSLTNRFLEAGVSGAVVDDALIKALGNNIEIRDHFLIQILVHYGADPNQHGNKLVRNMVLGRDKTALDILLSGSCSNATLCSALELAMEHNKSRVPLEFIKALLEAGAYGDIVSELLLDAVSGSDEELTRLLLTSSKPDANFRHGSTAQIAVVLPSFVFFDLLMKHAILDEQSKDTCFITILQLTSLECYRSEKLYTLLPFISDKQLLTRAIGLELEAQTSDPQILSALFDKGAEVDQGIVKMSLEKKKYCCLERILEAKPPQDDMDQEFLRSNDRKALNLFLSAGVSESTKGAKLLRATKARHRDLEWISQLLDYGAPIDYKQGASVVCAAANPPDETLLDLLLFAKPASSTLQAAFVAAMELPNQTLKVKIYEQLLRSGLQGRSVDEALLAAADGDLENLELSTLLLKHRASVDYKDGAAILRAMRHYNTPLLALLLAQSPSDATLVIAFNAAMRIHDVNLQEEYYGLILEAGLQGVQLDEALMQAAHLGTSGLGLCDLLLEHGASVNHSEGAAICTTVSALPFCEPLLLLLMEHSPSQDTIGAALSSCVASKAEDRTLIMEICLSKSKGSVPSIDSVLAHLIDERDKDYDCIKLVLNHGGMVPPRQLEFIKSAVDQCIPDLLALLLVRTTEDGIASEAFSHAFDGDNYGQSPDQLSVMDLLLQHHAQGEAIDSVLVEAIRHPENPSCQSFILLLLDAGANVNAHAGLSLQIAAESGVVQLVGCLLEQGSTRESSSAAFPYIFASRQGSTTVAQLIDVFCQSRSPPSMNETHFHFRHPLLEAFIVYPDSAEICVKLLQAGASTEEQVEEELIPGYGPEQMNLLMKMLNSDWSKSNEMHSRFIEAVLENSPSANVNARSSESQMTLLMLAVRRSRRELVQCLLNHGASVFDKDREGRSALYWATSAHQLDCIDLLLDYCGPKSLDDGSLHKACLDTDADIVSKLLSRGFNANRPCLKFDGRGALAELCLHAPTTSQSAEIKEIIDILISSGAKIDEHHPDKSLLFLALDGKNALETTQALIESCMWDHMNDEFNLVEEGRFCYSPIEYVSRGRNKAPQAQQQQLINLLKTYKCKPRYWAVSGEQPEFVINAPPHIQTLVQERDLRRLKLSQEEHDIQLRHEREQQELQHNMHLAKSKAWTEQQIAETQHKQELQFEADRAAERDAALLRNKDIEFRENSKMMKQQAERAEHESRAALDRQRLLNEGNLEFARQQNEQAVELARKMRQEAVDRERDLSNIRQRALDEQLTAQSQHQYQITQQERQRASIEQQRVNGQMRLMGAQYQAAKLWQAAGGMPVYGAVGGGGEGGRMGQIGYRPDNRSIGWVEER